MTPDPAAGRQPLIAGNWKMHHDHLVAIQVVQKLSYRSERTDYDACDVVICPPFTDLRTLQTMIESDRLLIQLGAQNCHWEDEGAYTGEVSPPMLAKLNVRYVIVGHSERRQLFGETDEIVNRKLQRGAEARHDADRLRRRDARGTRGGQHRRAGHDADAGRVRAGQGGGGRDVRGRVRADLGDRHRPQRDRRRRQRDDRRDPHRGAASCTARARRRRSASSTAGA